jgi:hypothetical protein
MPLVAARTVGSLPRAYDIPADCGAGKFFRPTVAAESY